MRNSCKKRLQFSKRLLSEAWEQYTIGNYARAEDLFLLAAREERFADIRCEATLGLSHTYRKTGRQKEAEVLLEDLVDARFRPEDTIPALADILIEKRKWDAARDLANGLPPELRAQWLEKIDESEYRGRIDDARRSVESAWKSFKAGDYVQAEVLFDEASEAMDEKVRNEGRLGLAYTFRKTGKDPEARAVFEDLVEERFKLEETFPRTHGIADRSKGLGCGGGIFGLCSRGRAGGLGEAAGRPGTKGQKRRDIEGDRKSLAGIQRGPLRGRGKAFQGRCRGCFGPRYEKSGRIGDGLHPDQDRTKPGGSGNPPSPCGRRIRSGKNGPRR